MKKKLKKSRKNKKKVTSAVVFLFVALFLLIVILGGLLLSDFGFFEKHEVRKFNVLDECSLIMGNLVHQIRNDGECKIRCVNECDVRDMEFVDFAFEGKIDDCNYCKCSCK